MRVCRRGWFCGCYWFLWFLEPVVQRFPPRAKGLLIGKVTQVGTRG
ncbi:hypothetical protein ebB156 [Aromatoleum aromaticum EbN1]|uniref:Uncharacterized protein n=1 Tax=Aromatoleum aromaticum (strain DSM 19018 / LMG 30748 / EbN1) TaxID=76114 RepID=Q5P1T5_AROAE|nr:hypothetical protein ebB156 [Aromatoleum aromaticum EbN1]